MFNYTCLILTHKNKASGKVLTPHLEVFKQNNPQCNVHIVVGEDHAQGKRYNWRNGDQPLRKWWLENSNLVATENVAVIEWDTLVNCELPAIPEQFDLVGAQYMKEPFHLRGKWRRRSQEDAKWTPDNWWWWREIPRLELNDGERACALVSLGCFLMRRSVLDAVCKKRWDKAYSKNIISEMRFPTAASIEGVRIGQIDLPFVHHSTMTYTGEKQIYHPIKQAQ